MAYKHIKLLKTVNIGQLSLTFIPLIL